MRALHRVAAPAGAVLVLFGLLSYAFTLDWDAWTAVHVVVGAALLVLAILANLAGFRRSVTATGTRLRLQAVAGTLLFAAILVAANVLAARYPWRYDATENRIHTLSAKTEGLLAGLERGVEVFVFLETADPVQQRVAELLDRFTAASPHLVARVVDAEREPQLADQLGVSRQGVVVARAADQTAQASLEATGLTEGLLTNLILKLTRPASPVVYVVSGHGEPAMDDTTAGSGLGLLAEALREQNIEVRDLLLAARPAVPEDAAVVIVAGPQKALTAHEVEQLHAYLLRGGRLLTLLDPGPDVGLEQVLAAFRLELGDDMIVDQEEQLFGGSRLGLDPIIDEFPPHPSTRDFRERIVLLQARSVRVAAAGTIAAAEAAPLARSRASSWAESGWRAMMASGLVEQDDADLEGPVTVAAAAEVPGESGTGNGAGARIVLVGDSHLAVNANLDALFNRPFVLGAIEWLAGRDELVAQGPRGLRPSRLDMTQSDFRMLFRLGVLLLPEALLVTGLVVWWRRRSR